MEIKSVQEAQALGRGRADIARRRVGLNGATFLITRRGQVEQIPVEQVGKTCCPAARTGTCRHLMALRLLQGEAPEFANPDLEEVAKAEYAVWMAGGYRGRMRAPLEVRLEVGRAVAKANGRPFVDYSVLGASQPLPWEPEE
jgi:hypothetical protein